MTTFRSCPVCNSEVVCSYIEFSSQNLQTRYKFSPEQVRFMTGVENGKLDVVKCRDCGMVYIRNSFEFSKLRDELGIPKDDPISIAELKKYHAEIGSASFLSKFHLVQQLLRTVASGRKEIKLLDFGGGQVGIYAKIANTFGRTRCTVFDPIIKSGKIDEISFLNQISQVKEEAPFDGIFCNHVLEHVQDPKAAISLIFSLLKEDGVVLFGVPLVNYWLLRRYKRQILNQKGWASKIFHPGHINYFSQKNFMQLVNEAGFEIIGLMPELHMSKTWHADQKLKNFFYWGAGRFRMLISRALLIVNFYTPFAGFFTPNIYVRKK